MKKDGVQRTAEERLSDLDAQLKQMEGQAEGLFPFDLHRYGELCVIRHLMHQECLEARRLARLARGPKGGE